MRLESKGVVRPPPKLAGPAQAVSAEIQSWPKIRAATHWYLYDRTQVDGADFYVGARELGHIHLDGEIHLALTPGLAQRLIEAGLAAEFPWGSDWVQAPIRTKVEARRAIWLFRLGYDRIRGAGIRELRERIRREAEQATPVIS